MLWPEVAFSEVTAPSLVMPSKDGNHDSSISLIGYTGMTELEEEEKTILTSMWLLLHVLEMEKLEVLVRIPSESLTTPVRDTGLIYRCAGSQTRSLCILTGRRLHIGRCGGSFGWKIPYTKKGIYFALEIQSLMIYLNL